MPPSADIDQTTPLLPKVPVQFRPTDLNHDPSGSSSSSETDIPDEERSTRPFGAIDLNFSLLFSSIVVDSVPGERVS